MVGNLVQAQHKIHSLFRSHYIFHRFEAEGHSQFQENLKQFFQRGSPSPLPKGTGASLPYFCFWSTQAGAFLIRPQNYGLCRHV